MPQQPVVSLSEQYQQMQGIIAACFNERQLEKITLSKYKGSEAGLEKILVRPVLIKQQAKLCFVYHYQTRDITKNYSLEEALREIIQQLDAGFKQLHVKTGAHDYQLMISKKGKLVLARQLVSAHLADTSEIPAHNRTKQRYIEQNRPFLQQLGVTDQQHQIIPAMSRKWKQINKFLEIFASAVQQARIDQQDTISVVDFGSGKGYLTFAVHDFIVQQLHKNAIVTGVELRDELVQFCNRVAAHIDAQHGIQFYQGDVRSFMSDEQASSAKDSISQALHPEEHGAARRLEPRPSRIDVMIALHACDVATDYALHTGIRLNAKVIMCAPCCHKEIRPQLQMPSLLQPMLQYGVHLGQQAEMLTDSMRALLLEAYGYETKVFEFVSLEHTSKNKMILAVKKQHSAAKQADTLQKIQALKQFYGIEKQSLEELLTSEAL
ncbi:class I SAM-dependent methyltransferase [Alkanindiges sp. WGS2144]|uniref:class I SAM-dependent methyltransferase n=1 Tax=Alkanindiges sp. WGS2144 TaxID=3366808 RepID=UPI0037538AB9